MKLFSLLIFIVSLNVANAQIIQKSENILKDTKSGLLWQDNKEAKTLKLSFKDSQEYCENLELDGVKGWSLPKFMEIFSIVDTKVYNPTLDKKFKNFVPEDYWCDKLFGTGKSSEAFVINFKSGAFNRVKVAEKVNVRCVNNTKTK